MIRKKIVEGWLALVLYLVAFTIYVGITRNLILQDSETFDYLKCYNIFSHYEVDTFGKY